MLRIDWFNFQAIIKGGYVLQGKKMVILIILICVVSLVLVYFWLQDVITEYDLDRALSLMNEKANFSQDVHKIS